MSPTTVGLGRSPLLLQLLTICLRILGLIPTNDAAAASLYTRMSHISAAIKVNLNYLMLKPVKAATLHLFTSGYMSNSPLNTPIFNVNAATATRMGTTQEIIYATYKLTGLSNYFGLEKTGGFWYYTNNAFKSCDVFGYRAGDPGSCPATTSLLPEDTPRVSALTSSCEQEYYVDASGTPLASFLNRVYDPRKRPWYIASKARGSAGWSPIYVFFDNKQLGITYTQPVLDRNSGALLGVLGQDYNLANIGVMLSTLEAPDIVQYVFVAASGILIAASTGEVPSSSDGSNRPKLCVEATNAMIRESASYLANRAISTTGTYSYTGADGLHYVFQLSAWSDSTGSLQWSIVAVTVDKDWVLDMSGEARHAASCIAADLTAFTDDAIYPAQYIAFLSGKYRSVPLDKPIIETKSSPQLKGITQQTLWGALASFPNSYTIWIGYNDKTMIAYCKIPISGYAQSYFYKGSGVGSAFIGYSVNIDGTPTSNAFYSTSSYDPTIRPWYTAAVTGKSSAWSGFFEFTIATGVPTIAFNVPIANTDGTTAGVVSVSRLLSSFTAMLAAYQTVSGVAYIMDASYGLVATSNGESVWVNKALKLATSSSDLLVTESATFIIANQINTANTYTMQLSNGQLVAVVHSPWSDKTSNLNWRVVVVSALDITSTVSTPTTSINSESGSLGAGGAVERNARMAKEASTAAAIFSSFMFVLLVVVAVKVFHLHGVVNRMVQGNSYVKQAVAEQSEDTFSVQNPLMSDVQGLSPSAPHVTDKKALHFIARGDGVASGVHV